MDGAAAPDTKLCPQCEQPSPTWSRMCGNRDCSYVFTTSENTVASRIASPKLPDNEQAVVSEVKGTKMETTFGVARQRSNSESSWDHIDEENPDSIEVINHSMVPTESSQTRTETEQEHMETSEDPLQSKDKLLPFICRSNEEIGLGNALPSSSTPSEEGKSDNQQPQGPDETMEVIEEEKESKNRDMPKQVLQAQPLTEVPKSTGCPLAEDETMESDSEPMDQTPIPLVHKSIKEPSTDEPSTGKAPAEPNPHVQERNQETQSQNEVNSGRAAVENEGKEFGDRNEKAPESASSPEDETTKLADSTDLITRDPGEIVTPYKDTEKARENLQGTPHGEHDHDPTNDSGPSQSDSVSDLVAPPTAPEQNTLGGKNKYTFMTPRITSQWPPPPPPKEEPVPMAATQSPPEDAFDPIKIMSQMMDANASLSSQNIDPKYINGEFVVAVPGHVNITP